MSNILVLDMTCLYLEFNHRTNSCKRSITNIRSYDMIPYDKTNINFLHSNVCSNMDVAVSTFKATSVLCCKCFFFFFLQNL